MSWVLIFSYVVICLLSLSSKSIRESYQGLFEVFSDDIKDSKKADIWSKIFLIPLSAIVIILTGVIYFIISPVFYIIILRRRANKKDKANAVVARPTLYKTFSEHYSAQPTDVQFVCFESTLPYKSSERDVIYIEDHYNVALNNFIAQNYEAIKNDFHSKGLRLVYLPYDNKSIADIEVISYYFPHINKIDANTIPTISYNDFHNNTTNEASIPSGFLKYRGNEGEVLKFSYYPFQEEQDIRLWMISYLNNAKVGCGKFYKIAPPENDIDIADAVFSSEATKLIGEIRRKVERLKILGISETMLMAIFSEKQKLSRMVITKDFKILLPDYNNMEIFMHPLPKAIFLLFLKHPEGILLKHLTDYKEELRIIYLKISNREVFGDLIKSIDDVVDSTKNSINEKCSRIREAFVKEFDESISHHYFITGERAEPKKIIIDRVLVTIEADL